MLLTRLDQAYGLTEERMIPRLPPLERHVDRRFAEPIGLLDDVLGSMGELAVALGRLLEAEGAGAREFHLFLYRVDHKMLALSVHSARLTRDPSHIAKLFRHRAERLEGDYDAGFGIDMIRLAAGAVAALDAVQLGAFALQDHEEDLDRLNDRMSSRLGPGAVLRTQLVASHLPERAARLVPAQTGPLPPRDDARPALLRPVRLLPVPEPVSINAEVPDGLPASMIWRGQRYRIERAAGPERLGAEWWRSGQRLDLVPEEMAAAPSKDEKPYIPHLEPFDPEAATRDYYVIEDGAGRRFWVYQQGRHRAGTPAAWYLHGLFA
jgi:protein ImuB